MQRSVRQQHRGWNGGELCQAGKPGRRSELVADSLSFTLTDTFGEAAAGATLCPGGFLLPWASGTLRARSFVALVAAH